MNIMLDLETLGGFGVENAAIIQIGAVAFTPDQVLADSFSANIHLHSPTFGVIDPGTLAWWMAQSEKARALAFEQYAAESLRDALNRFCTWVGYLKPDLFWANPASFDFPVLYQAAARAGVNFAVMPWKRTRCGSTLVNVCGVPEPEREGVHHNALDDARHQAKWVQQTLRMLWDNYPANK